MATIAMTGGRPLDNMVFTSTEQARNYSKWKFKQRTWKNESENIIKCKFTGRRIEFLELTEYLSDVI